MVRNMVRKNRIWSGGKSAQNAIKIGRIRRLVALIKLLKSFCPYLSLLCHYGGGRRKTGTREEMYYKSLSDQPEINYAVYNMPSTNILTCLDLPNSLRFIMNRKIPVQKMVDKEKHFVKAMLDKIS